MHPILQSSIPGAESHCWHRTPKLGQEGVRESEAWSHFTRRHGEAKCLHDINNNRHKLSRTRTPDIRALTFPMQSRAYLVCASKNQQPNTWILCAHFMCKCLECFASGIRKGLVSNINLPLAHTHTHTLLLLLLLSPHKLVDRQLQAWSCRRWFDECGGTRWEPDLSQRAMRVLGCACLNDVFTSHPGVPAFTCLGTLTCKACSINGPAAWFSFGVCQRILP